MLNRYMTAFSTLIVAVALVIYYSPLLFFFAAAFMDDSALGSGIPSFTYAYENLISWDQMKARINYIYYDSYLNKSVVQSIATSISTAITVAISSWVAGYVFTRSNVWWIRITFPLSLATYLLPPAVLAIGISQYGNYMGGKFISLQIYVGHCVYLFPLAYALSIGYWSQKPLEMDRIAVSDGLKFWDRLIIHMGTNEISRLLGVGLLVFMVSWGDTAFSRIISGIENADRLLVDLVFQRLHSNSITEAYGALSTFSLIVLALSIFFSAVFGFTIMREDNRRFI